jgi:hypothetical protein
MLFSATLLVSFLLELARFSLALSTPILRAGEEPGRQPMSIHDEKEPTTTEPKRLGSAAIPAHRHVRPHMLTRPEPGQGLMAAKGGDNFAREFVWVG